MKYLLVLLVILLTACGENKEIRKGGASFEMINQIICPPAVLKEKEITLGEATTQIIDDGKNRVSNITLACQSISGIKLSPGEEFSFNDVVGARSTRRGYKYAPVIFRGEKSYGVGGGVCQVSSTLYMAAKSGNFEITQRHQHSEAVAYAPEHTDATVVYGEKDFRFKNNTEENIYIYTWIEGDKVYAKIVRKDVFAEKSDNNLERNS